jgi:hypothetical protein
MKLLLCVDLCVYTMCLALDAIGRRWKQVEAVLFLPSADSFPYTKDRKTGSY